MPEKNPANNEILRWIQQAKEGDKSALGYLLDHFRPLLRSRSRETLGAAMQARVDDSDLIQQTCLAINNDILKFRGTTEPEFVKWVLRILERQVLRAVEREKGAAKRAIEREVADSQPIHNAAGEQTSPSQKAIRSENRKILLEAITQLSEDQQKVVQLKFIDELKLSEIVERVGKTEDAVIGLLRRGISRLNQLLQDQDLTGP